MVSKVLENSTKRNIRCTLESAAPLGTILGIYTFGSADSEMSLELRSQCASSTARGTSFTRSRNFSM